MKIKTRFAPSPTGFLHIGGLRTALYAYLFAKKNNGRFMIRVEDTDQGRFVAGGMETMLQALAWAGIHVDEGVMLDSTGKVVQEGDKGPYIQSERRHIYKQYVNVLLTQGDAYACFCTKERLDELRHTQEVEKKPTGYDGFCRDISQEEAEMRIQAGESHVIRMKARKEGLTIFIDAIRGQVEFKNALIDDQVLIKSDGFPTYHFAVVVDDHLMEITHVIRGEEWIPSTPKHVMLYSMFGWVPPTFAHLSLIVNEQKQKMSKRHNDVSVKDFEAQGYLPEALVNFIAFLGWNPGDNRELFSLRELEQAFSLDHVGSSSAVFNREKLDWYNAQYIRNMDMERLISLISPFLKSHLEAMQRPMPNAILLQKALHLIRDRLTKLVDAPIMLDLFFVAPHIEDPLLLVWKKSTHEETIDTMEKLLSFLKTIPEHEWNKEIVERSIGEWITNGKYSVGTVLWPMRVALSGEKNSPGPYEIADVLAKNESLSRFQDALARLRSV